MVSQDIVNSLGPVQVVMIRRKDIYLSAFNSAQNSRYFATVKLKVFVSVF